MSDPTWKIVNPHGNNRVMVTRVLPGSRWIEALTRADCRVEIHAGETPLTVDQIVTAFGDSCRGVIGQLTEKWDGTLFKALEKAGGRVYSNFAVGYNNVDLSEATRLRLPVGNTPGVLTGATAEMAVGLTLAAARRMGEAERYLRAGKFTSWHPTLMLGTLLAGRTLGIIGAGRIGSAYARMMVAGFGMNLIYFSPRPKPDLEKWMASHNQFLSPAKPLDCRYTDNIEALLEIADVISVHTPLNDATHHLLDAQRLKLMKEEAILVNTSRGPVIDEAALVAHCQAYPGFRVGLDVYEQEPVLSPGLDKLENVVLMPHLGSATRWTREGMALLAALNVAGVIEGRPLWTGDDIEPFFEDRPPRAVPSLVNGRALNYPQMDAFPG